MTTSPENLQRAIELLQRLARDPTFLNALENARTADDKGDILEAQGFGDVTGRDVAAAINQMRLATGLYDRAQPPPDGPLLDLRVYLAASLATVASEAIRGW